MIAEPKHRTNIADEMYKLKIFITKITHVRTFRWLLFAAVAFDTQSWTIRWAKAQKCFSSTMSSPYRLCVACCCLLLLLLLPKWWKNTAEKAVEALAQWTNFVSFFILKLNNIHTTHTHTRHEQSKSMLVVCPDIGLAVLVANKHKCRRR